MEQTHEEFPQDNPKNENTECDKKCRSAYSSVENSPLMDKESLLRYSASSRDEFWDALSSNYDYLMDDGLINTCREASSDLSVDDDSEISESSCWSFKQFIEQFKCLHDILHDLQVAKEDGSRKSDEEIFEERQKIAYLCKLFNEQAQKLSKRYPEMKDEVHRRLNLLNNKWKAVEQSINPNIVKSPSKDNVFDEITHRMSNLRKWLRELESRICPLQLSSSWSLEEKEEKLREQTALQKEIEAKGKHVSILLKLCEHLKGNVRFGQYPLMTWDAEHIRKVVKNLERHWHLILLKSHESKFVLENLLNSSQEECEKLEKSFSEEPLKKYPRLSDNYERIAMIENELKSEMNSRIDSVFLDRAEADDASLLVCEVTLKNDKAVMVGATGIAELKAECGKGKFEIVQDIGYSSETSAHLSTDEKLEGSPPQNGDVFLQNGHNNAQAYSQIHTINTSSKMYLAPDKYPSVSVKTFNILSDDRLLFKSKLNEPKSVPDRFYKVTCVDDELFEDSVKPKESSDTFHTAKDNSSTPNEQNSSNISKKISNCEAPVAHAVKPHRPCPKIPNVSNSVENSVLSSVLTKKQKRNAVISKSLHSNDFYKKSKKVCEWLKNCQSADEGTSDDNADTCYKPAKGIWSPKVVNSSCDASGECTANESDSEKSNISDVNNSITLSQSFTGSIETVIPAVAEDSGGVKKQTDNVDTTPLVKMRKKRRPRERPWSVIETHQGNLTHSTVPHSTSEGALDLLYYSQDSGKINLKSRKLSKNKRFSLTDVSLLCSQSFKHQIASTEQIHQSGSSSVESKKKGSISDPSSDCCENTSYGHDTTLLASEKESSMDDETLRSADKYQQNILPHVLPEISLSLETDTAGSAVNTEDQASISDQAWDEYQDPPYLSEPYSEQTADEDEVRKLINFGDDYRTILGSYSDVSSVNLRVPSSKHHRSRTKSSLYKSGSETCKTFSSDSNSDSEDFHNILKTSKHALQFVSNSIKENSTKMNSLSSEITELTATCQTNLCHLNAIDKELSIEGCEMESVTKEDILRLKGLIKEWEDLQIKVSALSRGEHKVNNDDLEAATLGVHCSLTKLKGQLYSLSEDAENALKTAVSLEQIASNIQTLQTGLSNLQQLKDTVLSENARILRLIADGGQALGPLKDSATKLYQKWEDVYELYCTQLTKLQTLQSQWCESKEKRVQENLETTVQWQPVQVGNNLPRAEVQCEAPYQKTAAEVQMADKLDIVFEIEADSANTTVQCLLMNNEEKEIFQEPVKQTKTSATADKMWAMNENIKGIKTDKKSKKSRSWFWRALLASVPVHIALVILYCLFLILEPQCCENMNNYDFSLLPRLRYIRGPPPA